jgi:hypothetical protein
MFGGIADFLSTVEPPYSIAIMPPSSDNARDRSVAQAKNYLDGYARNMFKLNIYWSDPFMFSIKLREGFTKFRQEISSSNR